MDYAPFHEELMRAVAEVTGAVRSGCGKPQTLFTSIEEMKVSVVEFAKDGLAGRGRPAPPYYAVEIGKLDFDPDWGMDSVFWRAPVRIGVLDATGNATRPTPQTVHALLERVRSRIDDPMALFDTFQRIEKGGVDSSGQNAVTQALLGESRVDVVAAVLSWSPGLQVWE